MDISGCSLRQEGTDIIVPDLRAKKVIAFFTTKHVGAEKGTIARVSMIPEEQIYLPVQKHTSAVQILRSDREEQVADAVVTAQRNVLLGVRVSDCVPILLYDPSRGVCGAVHAGWRGTADGILMKTIRTMEEEFDAQPADISIAIGPAIRWCCYKVGDDVSHAVVDATGEGKYQLWRNGSLCLDLPAANRIQAVRCGVPERNVWMSPECTHCSPGRFHSYRYEKRRGGSQGGFIGMIE